MAGRRRLETGLRLLVALIFIAYALFPVVYVIGTSLNPSGSLQTSTIFPSNPSLDNYRSLLTSKTNPFLRWMANSLLVSTVTSVLTVALCALAAYSFSRFRFKSRKRLLQGLLLSQVFPNILAIVAVFLMLQQIGRIFPMFGLNTLGGLILVYLGGAIGFNTWLMKGFFDTVPRDLDESAMLDGASPWQTFTTIILPLVRPVLAVIFMLSFIGTYGDYLMARVLLTNTSAVHRGRGPEPVHRPAVRPALGRVRRRRGAGCHPDHDPVLHLAEPVAGRPDLWRSQGIGSLVRFV